MELSSETKMNERTSQELSQKTAGFLSECDGLMKKIDIFNTKINRYLAKNEFSLIHTIREFQIQMHKLETDKNLLHNKILSHCTLVELLMRGAITDNEKILDLAGEKIETNLKVLKKSFSNLNRDLLRFLKSNER